MKIGVDIGNVIIGGPQGPDTQFFTDDYLETPEVPGAIESLQSLVFGKEPELINVTPTSLGEYRIHHELHIISKCGKIVEDKSMEWLQTYGFDYIIEPQNIHFVRKRHLKVFMAQALELKVFIDDMEDVIESMQGVVQYPILFTSWEQTNAELEKILQLTKQK